MHDDLLCADTFADIVILELLPDNVVIGCIYKPPVGDVTLFTAYLDTLLSQINSEKNIYYIVENFNIDLLKFDLHLPIADYVIVFSSHAFMPTASKPTRVTEFTATIN